VVSENLDTTGGISDRCGLLAEMLLELGYKLIVNSLILHVILSLFEVKVT
jgi:hypothetical protein